MVRAWLAKEFNPAPPRASKLIAQQDQSPPSIQELTHLGATALLRQHELSRGTAKLVDEPVEIDVVERTSNRVRGKSVQREQISAKFKIAKMAGNNHGRPRVDQYPNRLAHVRNRGVRAPIRAMQLARRVGNLGNHQKQVPPHGEADSLALGAGHCGKSD